MINNETLFDSMRSRRRRGFRTAWRTPVWATVNPVVAQVVTTYVPTLHGMAEPSQCVYETDMADDSVMVGCAQCGVVDYAAMLIDGTCGDCHIENMSEWTDTLAAIRREEYALG
jgi:hypothetical protein